MRINEGNPAETTVLSSESMTTSTGSSGDDYPAISEPPLPLATFSIEDCVYRGEGNANVVIALSQEHKVIRFRKSLPDDVPPDGGKQRAERELEFVKSVASCFLGPYAQIPKILRYDVKDIARLSEAIQPLRPDKRRHTDVTETYATQYPDYAFLRTKCDPDLFRSKKTFCVEIKPKQGYSRDADNKFQKCPYCLAQYYKLQKKVIAARSTYCPFDLFSGVEERMKSALKGLLISPQNNLKIFKDGVVVYDQESSLNDLACNLKGGTLPKNCVLERILHMQKLPFISSEYVYNVHSKFRPLLTDDIIYSNLIRTHKFHKQRISSYKSTSNVTKHSDVSQETHLKTYIKDDEPKENVPLSQKSTSLPMHLQDNNLSCDKSNVIHSETNLHSNEKETNLFISSENILRLQNYLLFSCARDCSILIAFRELDTNTELSTLNEGVIKLSDGLCFLCNIGVSDLEPKSLRCIEKHRQRDTNVLNAVISIFEKELIVANQSLMQN
ncbi:inositol phosphate kinase 1 isoform X3 [Colletes latitarsis]|uniref:inositol phosphate kinase 1 isoform X3 n=1 Tax=Colletes latitarsis TaxID=2605962 RepID=UPI0040366B43